MPIFDVSEALLSDRGTNLLSYLMKDGCSFLGIKKLNTTAYHPQCDGMVERFNCILIAILKKSCWEIWFAMGQAYSWKVIVIHLISLQEKNHHYMLFGFDCRSPTVASLLPTSPKGEIDVTDCWRELTLSMKHAKNRQQYLIRKLRQNTRSNMCAASTPFTIGDMALIHFPQEECEPRR